MFSACIRCRKSCWDELVSNADRSLNRAPSNVASVSRSTWPRNCSDAASAFFSASVAAPTIAFALNRSP